MSNEEKDIKSTSEELDIDLGDENTFFVANNGNYFGIAFDKFFHRSELEVYNTFDMTSKRNFKNLSPTICTTYEELFLDKDENFIEEYALVFYCILHIKSIINASDTVISYDTFISYMKDIIDSGDGLLYNIINKFVDNNYALELDKITQETKDKKRKVNTELQFSDQHARELLKIAYIYRVMIPLISEFFIRNKEILKSKLTESIEVVEDEDDMEFNEVNSKVFAYLFERFSANPDALRNKLYRLTFSGVSKTAYSDKRFWLAAKNVAITERSEALEIYKKLLTNAIPKLDISGDRNVISFLQSVINNQVDFLFQNKFKYHFVQLGANETALSTDDNDDSNMTEFERIEIQQSRRDEGSYLIRKMNIKETISKIPDSLDVGLSDAEVKDLMNKITRNNIQEQIIAIMTFKFFNDKDALKFVTFYQYCYLLIACKKYLLEHKYIYLPQILTAHCQKHKERINISGKKVRPEILSSKKYTDLIDMKYSNFKDEIEKPFLSFVATVYSSEFTDSEGNELFDSSVKVGKIAEEILQLIDNNM